VCPVCIALVSVKESVRPERLSSGLLRGPFAALRSLSGIVCITHVILL